MWIGKSDESFETNLKVLNWAPFNLLQDVFNPKIYHESSV